MTSVNFLNCWDDCPRKCCPFNDQGCVDENGDVIKGAGSQSPTKHSPHHAPTHGQGSAGSSTTLVVVVAVLFAALVLAIIVAAVVHAVRQGKRFHPLQEEEIDQ